MIAKQLRVSVRSVQRRRKTWTTAGPPALRSKGPASTPRLNPALVAVLEQEPGKGPAAHGWADQKWTLLRIKTVIGRRFHKSYRLKGVALLLHRHGRSRQTPTRRATERDEDRVTGWVKEPWPQSKASRRRSGPGWSSKTRPASR
ncbi:winged helix-turn-helix domain-containing protein [Streptosporangium roseum]|uniref:winged helix-turn-helix domain-containing protein n=1 Tax=Streptosporangium roseum TaxID=2001 RepID=UPI003330F320